MSGDQSARSGATGTSPDAASSLIRGLLDWARSASLAPYVYATGCCAVEIESAWGPHGDLGRLVGWTPRTTPEHADVLLVGGAVNARQAPAVQRVYARMSSPKWVVSIGDCPQPADGRIGYTGLRRVSELVPVDVAVPGCPPSPEAIVEGLLLLRSKIARREADPE